MTEDVLTFEELRQVQSRERDSDTLQELDDDFFERARAYLDMKRDGDSVLQNQEYRNARNLLQDIVDRRQKKIVKLAFLSVKSGVSVENLMAHEEDLFDDLTDAIDDHRYDIEDALLDGDGMDRAPELDGEDGGEATDPDVAQDAAAAEGSVADEPVDDEPVADLDQKPDGDGDGPADDGAEEDEDEDARNEEHEDDADGEQLLFGGDAGDENDGADQDGSDDADEDGSESGEVDAADEDDSEEPGDGMARVRATTDVQEFMGTDLEAYGPFEEGDEAVVPEKNADVLQEQGKAERL